MEKPTTATLSEPSPRSARPARIAVRVAFACVFALNVSCALGFIADPASFAPAYELGGAGVAGEAAVRGIGVAFLMWNVTYPPVIVSPERCYLLAWVVIAQQVVGLVGELLILASLPVGHAVLAAGIVRFAAFDGAGLAVMCAALLWLASRRPRARLGEQG